MCKNCQLKPVYEFTNKRKLCKKCFIRYFQKKVLYISRKFKMINKDEVLGYKHGKDFRSVVLEDVLKMFAEKWVIKLVRLPSKKKVDKIAIPSTIDLEADKFIHEIINKKLQKLNDIKPVNGKVIKPLYLFLDKEVLLYAKLKNLKFKKKMEKKDKINSFIDGLEKKHPEVKRAVVNSYLKLYD